MVGNLETASTQRWDGDGVKDGENAGSSAVASIMGGV